MKKRMYAHIRSEAFMVFSGKQSTFFCTLNFMHTRHISVVDGWSTEDFLVHAQHTTHIMILSILKYFFGGSAFYGGATKKTSCVYFLREVVSAVPREQERVVVLQLVCVCLKKKFNGKR